MCYAKIIPPLQKQHQLTYFSFSEDLRKKQGVEFACLLKIRGLQLSETGHAVFSFTPCNGQRRVLVKQINHKGIDSYLLNIKQPSVFFFFFNPSW